MIKADSFVYLPQMKDKSVDLILTDPPYDFDETEKQFLHWHFLRISRFGIIVFSPPENQWILPADQYLFWIKPLSTKNTSRRYSRFVEMLFLYGNLKWRTGAHWSQYTNVFTDLVDYGKLHPFRKPPSLIKRLLLNHTGPSDTVLGPFAGSGVVEQVCQETNRQCISIDLHEYTSN